MARRTCAPVKYAEVGSTEQLIKNGGPLPEDWAASVIGEEVEFTRKQGGDPSSRCKMIPFIPMDLLPTDSLYTERWETRSADEVSSGVYFKEGDILLAKITPCLENGKQAIAKGIPGGWGIATTEVFPLRSRRLLTEFLALYLKGPEVRRILASKMQGATGRQRLPREALESFPVPVPGIDEQRDIVHILCTVQRAREATEKVIAATRQLKASLMRHLFTYGPVAVKEADRVRLQETEIGPIPSHWQVDSLGNVSEFMQYGTSSRCSPDPFGSPVLRIPNVIGDVIDSQDLKYIQLDEEETRKYLLGEGDLLFVRTNGRREYIGRCAVYRGQPSSALFASYLIRSRLCADEILPDFMQLYATTPAGRANLSGRASGSADGKFNINTQILKSVLLPKPTIEEQAEITRIVGAVSQTEAAARMRSDALGSLFESLMHNLMTGKLRVKDLDPTVHSHDGTAAG